MFIINTRHCFQGLFYIEIVSENTFQAVCFENVFKINIIYKAGNTVLILSIFIKNKKPMFVFLVAENIT